MLSYAEAEALLASFHRVDADIQKGAFRGRLKHLKRLGVPLDSNPGRGQKTTYGFEHLCQWAFCLELEVFGIDPTAIVRVLKTQWAPTILPAFRAARVAKGDLYLAFSPNFLRLTAGDGLSPGSDDDVIADFTRLSSKGLAGHFAGFMSRGDRFGLFNISILAQAIEHRLKKAEGR